MKKKLIVLSTFIFILSFGFVYMQYDNLFAGDKTGKDCSSKTSCESKTDIKASGDDRGSSDCSSKTSKTSNDLKAGGDYKTIEFVTTSVTCDGSKSAMTEKLMSVAGVKEVVYGNTCSVSKNTNVQLLYSDTEVTEETLVSELKNVGIDCSGKSGCTSKKTNEGKDI